MSTATKKSGANLSYMQTAVAHGGVNEIFKKTQSEMKQKRGGKSYVLAVGRESHGEAPPTSLE